MPALSPPMPALIRIGQTLALVTAVAAAIATTAFILASPYDSAALELISPHGLWCIRALVAFALYSAVALFFIYRGIKHRRPWARPLIVAFCAFWEAGNLTPIVFQEAPVSLWSAALIPALLLIAVVWYLYFKPSVTAYFASLRNPNEAGSVA